MSSKIYTKALLVAVMECVIIAGTVVSMVTPVVAYSCRFPTEAALDTRRNTLDRFLVTIDATTLDSVCTRMATTTTDTLRTLTGTTATAMAAVVNEPNRTFAAIAGRFASGDA
jgi:hypothetical protein